MAQLNKTILAYVISLAILATLAVPHAHARDAARDLRRLQGYCIMDASAVREVLSPDTGGKFLVLENGVTFKVDFLLLKPLPLTDVIVFAKPLPPELEAQFKGKVPDQLLFSFKLLIDNEVVDAQPVHR